MKIAVLGPIVVGGRGDLSLRDRAVLGVLMVRAGSTVEMSELADAIWGDQPPATHRKVVQGCVVRLRRQLGEDSIVTREGGYSLVLPADEMDTTLFEALVDTAQSALDEGDPRRAAECAGDVLEFWRGDPYPELPEWAPAQAEAQRLRELREIAREVEVEATLLSGRAASAAVLAEALASATPYREERWALLARAQYAAGRQADALATLRTLRDALAEELGIDPSPEIAALEAAMLRQDPSLDLPSSVGSGRWLFSRTGRIVAAVLALATVVGVGVALHQRNRANHASRQAAAAGTPRRRSASASSPRPRPTPRSHSRSPPRRCPSTTPRRYALAPWARWGTSQTCSALAPRLPKPGRRSLRWPRRRTGGPWQPLALLPSSSSRTTGRPAA